MTQTTKLAVGEIEANTPPTYPHLTTNHDFIEGVLKPLPELQGVSISRIVYDVLNSKDDNPTSFLNTLSHNILVNSTRDYGERDPLNIPTLENEEYRDMFLRDRDKLRDRIRYAVKEGAMNGQDRAEAIIDRDRFIRTGVSPSSTSGTARVIAPQYANILDQEFVDKTNEVASRLGIRDVNELLRVFDLETRGTFSASEVNPDSGATGLIQFMSKYGAKTVGKTLEELKAMSRVEQLDYVEKYLQIQARTFNINYEKGSDIYMAVFNPANANSPLDNVLYRRGSTGYAQNATSFDKEGKGYFTHGDVRNEFERIYGSREYTKTQVETEPQEISGDNLPLKDFRKIILDNKDQYPEFFDDGNFKYDDNAAGRSSFIEKIKANPEVVDRLFNQRFGLFQAELGKSHNVQSYVEGNTAEMAKAFAVWDKFGNEGLTQYFNYMEEYNPNLTPENQTDKWKRAHRFLLENRQMGMTPAETIAEFIGSPNSKHGQFTIYEQKANLDAYVEVPRDFNEFTAPAYNYNKVEKFNLRASQEFIRDIIDYYNIPTQGLNVEKIETDDEEFKRFTLRVRDHVGIEKLFEAALGAGQHKKAGGRDTYVIEDYDQLPFHSRLAIEVLRNTPGYDSMIYRNVNNPKEISIEPNRADRAKFDNYNHWANLNSWVIATEDRIPVISKIADIFLGRDFDENQKPATGAIGTIWNTGVAFGMSFTDLAFELADWGVNAVKFAASNLNPESSDYYDALYDNTFGELRQYNAISDYSWDGASQITPQIGYFGGMLKNFVTLLRGIGRGTLTASGNLADLYKIFGPVKGVNQVAVAGKGVQTFQPVNKWADIISTVGRNSREAAYGGGAIYVGDAVFSAFMPKHYSLFGMGVADFVPGSQTIARQLGAESLEEAYKASGTMGKVVSDVISNLAIGALLDGVISMVRTTPKLRSGQYWRSTWKDTDLGRFQNEVSKVINDLPNIASKAQVGRHISSIDVDNIKSLDDLAKHFKYEASDMLSSLRRTIEETISYYDMQYTGKVRPNLKEFADELYKQQVRKIARQIDGFFVAGETNLGSGQLNAFVRRLESQGAVVREQSPGKLYSLAEANKVYSESADTLLIKRDKTNPNQYRIYEVHNDDWVTDLTRELRAGAIKDEKSFVLNRRENEYRRANNGEEMPASAQAEALSTIDDVLGLPVITKEGKRGYILDKEGDSFWIRTDDGRITREEVPNETLKGLFAKKVADDQITDIQFDQLVKKYKLDEAPVGKTANHTQDEVRLLAQNAESSTSTALVPTRKILSDLRNESALSEEKALKEQALRASAGDSEELDKIVDKIEKVKSQLGQGLDEASEASVYRVLNRLEERASMLRAEAGSFWEFPKKILASMGVQIPKGMSVKKLNRLIAEKLGLDHELNLFKKGKNYALATNVGEILEYKATGKTIKPGVVVKKVREDGSGFDYYISTKSIKATEANAPFKFLQVGDDADFILNPTWRQVNRNVTINPQTGLPFRFQKVRKENGETIYVELKENLTDWNVNSVSDEAVFLNIQSPMQTGSPSPLGPSRGYDAFEEIYNGRRAFSLVDETNQVISPRKLLEEPGGSIKPSVTISDAKWQQRPIKLKATPEDVEFAATKAPKPRIKVARKVGSSSDENIVDRTPQPDLIEDVIGAPGIVRYAGSEGYVIQEGQQVVFVSGNKIHELGNIEQISGRPISEFGVERVPESGMSVSSDFDVQIGDQTYVNRFSDPMSAVNRDADGKVVSVNLETPDGKKRTFRGERADEIAYNYTLKTLGASTLLGGVIGQAFTNEENVEVSEAGIGIGGLVGAGLGMVFRGRKPRVRNTVGKAESVFTSTPPKVDGMNEAGRKIYDMGKKQQDLKEIQEVGIRDVDINNPTEVQETKAFVRGFKSAVELGKDFAAYVRTSPFTNAAFQFLEKGSKTMGEIGRGLFSIDKMRSNLMTNVNAQFNRLMNDSNAYRMLEASPENANSPFMRTAREHFAQITKEPLDDSRLYEQWNESWHRIKTANGKIVAGMYVTDPNTLAVGRTYSLQPHLRELDSKMISLPEMRNLIDAQNKALYGPVKKMNLKQIDNAVESHLEEAKQFYTQDQYNMLLDFTNTRLSAGKFVSKIKDKAKKEEFKKLVRNEGTPAHNISVQQSRKQAFTDMGDKYVTQLLDRNKYINRQKQFARGLQKGKYEGKFQEQYNSYIQTGMNHKDAADKVSERMLYEEFSIVNDRPEHRNKFRYLDRNNADVVDKTFTTRTDAEGAVHRILAYMDEPLREGIDVRSFIEEVSEGTFIVRIPDNIDPRVKTEFFKEINDAKFQHFKQVLEGNFVKNSNFLDRPRQWEIPNEWAVTDARKLMERYAADVSGPLTVREMGIYSPRDLQKKMNKIRQELRDSGFDDATTDRYLTRVKNIFDMQTGVINRIQSADDPARALRNYMRQERISNIVRSAVFAPFGYMIAFYDTFQSMVLGPALSSGKSVKEALAIVSNRESLQQVEEMTKMGGLSMKKIEVFKPEYRSDYVDWYVSDSKFDSFLEKADRFTHKMADFSASFSITRGVIEGTNRGLEAIGSGAKLDIENLGVMRLAFDNFYGINSISTSVNWLAGVIEAQHLSSLYRQLLDNPELVSVQGRGMLAKMSKGDIENKFAMLGVPRERVEQFVRESENVDNFLSTLRNGEDANIKMFEKFPELRKDMFNIMETMTETYHGKNRMFRPETWSSPIGKALVQFSVYPFNVGMQLFNRRIADPMRRWNENFGSQLTENNFWNVQQAAQSGDRAALRKMGLSEDAIDAIPLESINNVMRTLYYVAAAQVTFLTRDAVMDFIEAPIYMAAGNEENSFYRTKRWGIVNPMAPQSEQVTWAQIADGHGMTLNEFFGFSKYTTAQIARSGIVGRWGDITNSQNLANNGLTSLSAPASRVDQLFKTSMRIINAPIKDLPATATKEIVSTTLGWTPVVGSYSGAFRTNWDNLMPWSAEDSRLSNTNWWDVE